MSNEINFFEEKNLAGVFQGLSNSGLEFHADIMLPYEPDLQVKPMHGSFLLIELENEDEAVLGRISSLRSEGRLSGNSGSEYAIRTRERGASIPEDIKKDYLRYKVDIRVLGALRKVNGTIVFAPSHRRLPHVGSRVAFPNNEAIKEIICHNEEFGVPIGHFALGEYVYASNEDKKRGTFMDWHKIVSPCLTPRFDIENLRSKRTFVFARSGYGKSNLNKLLFSELYKQESPPSVFLGDEKVAVGTIIFDPEGEYFWPDNNRRPGFADVSGLKDRLMVFTEQEHESEYYQSFKVEDAKLNLAELSPYDILSLALSRERMENNPPAWAISLMQMSINEDWEKLIDRINDNISPSDLRDYLNGLDDYHFNFSDKQAGAIRRELYKVVKRYHKENTFTLKAIERGLEEGMIIVFDLSQMNAKSAENITRIVMKSIFNKNQQAFTEIDEKPIPTIAVLEEAQSVLGGTNLDDTDPIVSWVKEGRKYNLGAYLITQQPGAISNQLLSQGDNWFVFHLISNNDLTNLKKANRHFSDDLLQSILNEPIKGQGMFWSSGSVQSSRPYPIPVRIFDFEKLYNLIDPDNTKIVDKTNKATEIRDYFYRLKNTDIYEELKRAMEELLKSEEEEDLIFKEKLQNKEGNSHANYFAKRLHLKANKDLIPDNYRGFEKCKENIDALLDDCVGENWEVNIKENKKIYWIKNTEDIESDIIL